LSYPAFTSFGKEIRRGYAVWRVYMALQPPRLSFHKPCDVKATGLATELQMGRRHVIKALNELVASGFLVEQGRDHHGVRSLMLAYAIASEAAD
jgi:hypothetical protein